MECQKVNNNINELGSVYKQSLDRIEKQLKLMFIENEREMNEIQNKSVEQLQTLLKKEQKYRIDDDRVEQYNKRLM